MIIRNSKVFYDSKFQYLDVEVEGDRITNIGKKLQGEESVECAGKLLLPGFIDVHTHGREGLDFSTANPEEIGKMCTSYARNGVTSLLATTMTMPFEKLKKIMENNRIGMEAGFPGSKIFGINLEGPFLGTDRKGCHDEEYLSPLREDVLDELNVISGNKIKLVDLDPNLPGALTFISKYSKTMTISLAHTSVGYELACEAVKVGATHITHLFNAMNGLNHREPGMVGMASDLPVNAELICDGIHIHPAVIRMIFQMMGERIVVISDSMSAAGLGEGEYELGGLQVFVKDRKATLFDGTIAGSTTNIFEEVKNLIEFGIPQEKAIRAATLNPARALKVDHEIGEIKIGKKADLLVVSPDFFLEQVYIDGKRFQ